MGRAIPRVFAGKLTDTDAGLSIDVGSPEWTSWLQEANTRSFAFRGDAGVYTARKETQGSRSYWYAYRRREGKVRKAYIGKSEAVSAERLEQVAISLSPHPGKARQGESGPPAVDTTSPTAHDRVVTQSPPANEYWRTRLRIKLLVPGGREDLIQRPRLESMLRKGLKGKLTLLSAPAGYGKTTALRQFVPNCGVPSVWLSLDRDDNDPAVFIQFLVAAIQAVEPSVGECVSDVLYSNRPNATDVVVTTLLNEVATISRDFLLVLDNYSAIDAEPVHDIVSFLIEHMPEKMHMVIAGRSDPPIPIAVTRSRGELVEIRTDDLKLTPAEASAFLEASLGFRPSPEDLDILEERTEGWIAGLQLAALAASNEQDFSSFLREFRGSHRYYADFLLSEILARQPLDTQTFLLETSILGRMTGSMCDEVLEITGSQKQLEKLEKDNLFIVPLNPDRTWFRYHQLFSEFLIHRLNREHPGRAVELHSRAAGWCERNGLTAEAVEHALAAGEFDHVVRLLRPAAMFMITHGQHATLARWLDSLPEEITYTDPQICLWYASALLVTGVVSERQLQKAEDASAGKVNLGEVLCLRAHAASLEGDISRSIELAQRALVVLPEGNTFQRGIANLVLGEALYFAGNAGLALEALSEARLMAGETDNILVFQRATEILGLAYIQAGRLNNAAELFRQLVGDSAGHRQWPTIMLTHLGMAMLHCEFNELDEATDHLEFCLQREQLGLILALGHVVASRILRARGSFEEALSELDAAVDLLHPNRHESQVSAMSSYKARIWLAQGNLTAASKWAEQCGLYPDDLPDYEHEVEFLTLARVLTAQGKPGEALRLLERVTRATEQAGRGGAALEALLLQALAFQASKQMTSALLVFEKALSVGAPEGYCRVFMDEGEQVAELLRQADSAGIHHKYARRLMDELEREIGILPIKSQDLIEPLTGRELEILHLVVSGLANTQIAREMFISENTVKKHVSNIFRKLDVTNRLEAANRARELRLL